MSSARCGCSRRRARSAIQIEDQDFPKRCGHLDDKSLIPAAEMAGKIKAAVDARHSSDTLIIARTDAVAVEGFERAIERAVLYRDAGADVLFVEAPKAREELAGIVKQVGRARAADGQYGRGRQDTACCRRPSSKRSAFRW